MEENQEDMTNTFNSVMTETAENILGKFRHKTQPWVTDEVLDMCDERKELKSKRHTTKKVEYKEISKKIRKP